MFRNNRFTHILWNVTCYLPWIKFTHWVLTYKKPFGSDTINIKCSPIVRKLHVCSKVNDIMYSPESVLTSVFDGTWNILTSFVFSVAQKICWAFLEGQTRLTPSSPSSMVNMSWVLGSGSQDERGTSRGRWYESHHSIHCVTSGSMLRGYSSVNHKVHIFSNTLG